jgi:hypothetical protein
VGVALALGALLGALLGAGVLGLFLFAGEKSSKSREIAALLFFPTAKELALWRATGMGAMFLVPGGEAATATFEVVAN